MKKHEFYLKDLDCASCANKIQNKLSENSKYQSVVCNFNTLKLVIETDEEEIKEEIVEIIGKLEPEVMVYDYEDKEIVESGEYEEHEHHHEYEHNHEHEESNHRNTDTNGKKKISKTKLNVLRLFLGLLLMIIGMFFELSSNEANIFIVLAYIVLLLRTGKNAFKLLKRGTIDENLLVTISCIGAYFIGKQSEGLMVIILYEIGKILEDKAVNNTRKSIASLMDIKPEYANLKHIDHEHRVSPNTVNVGDIIVVKQGEKVPLDGKVISGSAFLNVSSLTGESNLKEVVRDDEVLSGSINEKGLIDVKVTKKYEDSTVSRILELVENATDKKAKTETMVNRLSRIYTPIVIIMAVLTFILLPIITGISFSESIYRALIFLVVSCPCAIVISVPLSYFSAIGKASKNGILIKVNVFATLKEVDCL